jgi:hypothetical protein
MDQTRRRFFKGAAIVGAFAAGFMAPKVVVAVREKTSNEDISHLAPESPTTLVLQGNPKPVESPPTQGGGFYITPSQEYQNKVAMSVGKDNRLWIQVDGQWRRVALDPVWCDPTYCDPAPDE